MSLCCGKLSRVVHAVGGDILDVLEGERGGGSRGAQGQEEGCRGSVGVYMGCCGVSWKGRKAQALVLDACLLQYSSVNWLCRQLCPHFCACGAVTVAKFRFFKRGNCPFHEVCLLPVWFHGLIASCFVVSRGCRICSQELQSMKMTVSPRGK